MDCFGSGSCRPLYSQEDREAASMNHLLHFIHCCFGYKFKLFVNDSGNNHRLRHEHPHNC